MNGKARVHIIVKGLVQGIFFRVGAKEKARQLGITGWVRNLDSGKVEIVAEGEKKKLEELVEWCNKGPSSARIEEIKTEWQSCKAEFKNFDIRH